LFRDAKPKAAEKSRRRTLRGQDREDAYVLVLRSDQANRVRAGGGFRKRLGNDDRRFHIDTAIALDGSITVYSLTQAGVELADRNRIRAWDPRSPAFARMSHAKACLALDVQTARFLGRAGRRSTLCANRRPTFWPKVGGESCRSL
jgi:hypothetical protein